MPTHLEADEIKGCQHVVYMLSV